MRDEVEAAGFTVAEVTAVEGPAFAVPDLAAWWNDAGRRELIMTAVRSVEHEPSLMGMSSRIMVTAHKRSV